MNDENWILEYFDPRVGHWGTFLLDNLTFEYCYQRMVQRMKYENVLAEKTDSDRRFQWRMRELTTNELICGDLVCG